MRCDRENTAGLPLIALAQFSCTCLVNSIIAFAFKVATLIFFVSAEYESKKMRSEFDNVTPACGTR